MKKIILCLALVAIAFSSIAQSLSTSGLSIVPSAIDPEILVASVSVNNLTTSPLNVMCQRTQNNLFPGHSSYFCWDLCYDDTIDISDGPLTIAANGSNNLFVGDLKTHGIAGTSIVTYCFFVQGNPGDQTCITINYPVGIETLDGFKSGLSAARPNPADAFTTMTYSLKNNPSHYKIELVNIIGKKIAEYSLKVKDGVITIPTNNLNPGIYFYVLKESDKTISCQKLVVTHK